MRNNLYSADINLTALRKTYMMQSFDGKLVKLFILTLSFTFLTATSTLDYTRKVDPLPNMPKGNPDPNMGIVVHENSTGVDVLANSSQNIRFSLSKNRAKTHIERLSSSSMVDRTPKKFKFVDPKYGFLSNNIYEFSIWFSYLNHEWEHIRFMPFPSVIEWVTDEKLRIYLDKWVKTFDDSGWTRIKYPKSNNPNHIQHFTLPTPEYNYSHEYCSWKTQKYKAVIKIRLRDDKDYIDYVPKADRKNIIKTPHGYIAFIDITNNAQYQKHKEFRAKLRKEATRAEKMRTFAKVK